MAPARSREGRGEKEDSKGGNRRSDSKERMARSALQLLRVGQKAVRPRRFFASRMTQFRRPVPLFRNCRTASAMASITCCSG